MKSVKFVKFMEKVTSEKVYKSCHFCYLLDIVSEVIY